MMRALHFILLGVKIPLAIFWILSFILYSFAGRAFIYNEEARLRFHSTTTSFFTRQFLKILGIRVKLSQTITRDTSYLILSNHLSYIDILIISAMNPALFITSKEIEKDLFLGTLSKLGGSFFIERRIPSEMPAEISRIGSVLRKGFQVVLFPEGTTSNGEKLLPFKKSLLACAVESETPILPLCLKYKSINRDDLSQENRDLLFWYGNMDFFPHFWKLLTKVWSVDVELKVLDTIPINTFIPASQSRKEAATLAFTTIQEAFQNIT